MILIIVVLLFTFVGAGAVDARAATDAHSDEPCEFSLRINYTQYPDTPDETSDILTVCKDGKLLASHSFTAPAFGVGKPEKTKWDYEGNLDGDALSDAKKVFQRSDISRIAEQPQVVIRRENSQIHATMRFSIRTTADMRTILLRGSLYIACGEQRPEIPEEVRDLMCLFSDLYARAKSGSEPDGHCGCKSLKDLTAERKAE